MSDEVAPHLSFLLCSRTHIVPTTSLLLAPPLHDVDVLDGKLYQKTLPPSTGTFTFQFGQFLLDPV
jgi:hypothetical protein